MATVLAYTSPAKGHLFPTAAILLELRRRGHRIVLRTLDSEVPAMRELGFEAVALDPRIPELVEPPRLPRGTVAALRASIGTFAQRAPFEAADLRKAIEEHQPDAVLVDVNSWGGLAEAERWASERWASERAGSDGGSSEPGDGQRLFVELFPYTPPIPSRDTPPFGPGLPPARGPLGRLRDAILRPVVFGTLERAVLPMLNEVRRGLGLSDVADARDMFTRAPLMLITTAEPFEYRRSDWPAQAMLIGPCEWEPSAPEPAWLSEVADPIVLVTTSSEAQDDGRLVQVALEAFAGEPYHVVATLPAGIRTQYRVPANAHLDEFIPHSVLLRHAVVAVTHGGMGATQKALARGVPVCVVPFGRDQHEVAQRVRTSGAGTTLRPSQLTPDRLRAAVAEARNRTAEARRIQEAMAAAGGPVAAADAIEHRLAHRTRYLRG